MSIVAVSLMVEDLEKTTDLSQVTDKLTVGLIDEP
jgi:hypothetical protein